MSGIEVLGAISAVIAIIDGSLKIWAAAHKDIKLPKTFKIVAGRLPVLQETLAICKEYFDSIEQTLSRDTAKALLKIIERYKANARKLADIFKETIPGPDDERLQRYRMVVKSLGKGSKVEDLMKSISEDTQILVNYHTIKSARPDLYSNLEDIIKELQNAEPSLPDEYDSTNTFNAYDGGTMYAQTGPGTWQQNTGTGPMIISAPGGNPVYNFAPPQSEHWFTDKLQFAEQGQYARIRHINSKNPRSESFEWLWHNKSFSNWLTSSDKAFWVTGKPASGKSTLMNYLANIKTLKGNDTGSTSSNSELLRVHFFFNYAADTQSELSNTLEGLKRSILDQLCKSVPELSATLEERFDLRGKHRDQWLLDGRTLTEMLDFAFERSHIIKRPIFLLLDGLDDYKGDLSEIVELIHYLTNKQSIVKLCVSSRPEEFRNQFRDWPQLSMERNNTPGIVAHTLIKLRTLYTEPSTEQLRRLEELSKNIALKSSGVFVWASFATDEMHNSLRRNESIEEQETRLNSLPASLTKLYDRIIDQLGNDRHVCGQVIRLITSSKGLLHVSELFEACNLAGIPILSHDGLVNNDVLHKFVAQLLRKTGGLLDLTIFTINTKARAIDNGVAVIVQLVHRTLRDYLDHQAGWSKLLESQEQAVLPAKLWLEISIAYFRRPSQWSHPSLLDICYDDKNGRPERAPRFSFVDTISSTLASEHASIKTGAIIIQKTLDQHVFTYLPDHIHDYDVYHRRAVRPEVVSLLNEEFIEKHIHGRQGYTCQCSSSYYFQVQSANEIMLSHGCRYSLEEGIKADVQRYKATWRRLFQYGPFSRISQSDYSLSSSAQHLLLVAAHCIHHWKTAADTAMLRMICTYVQKIEDDEILRVAIIQARAEDLQILLEQTSERKVLEVNYWNHSFFNTFFNRKPIRLIRASPLWFVPFRYPDEETRKVLNLFIARGENITRRCGPLLSLCDGLLRDDTRFSLPAGTRGSVVHAGIIYELYYRDSSSSFWDKKEDFKMLSLLMEYGSEIDANGPNEDLQHFTRCIRQHLRLSLYKFSNRQDMVCDFLKNPRAYNETRHKERPAI